ncbi:hypothetical protein ACFVY4_31175 [Streptomyces sp. NPDC058299]|uniref:hypothetical protein n=1 Tax=Streptomyces sp. NPDC058299 TaxID=3346435 RepID=UPI0036EDBF2B
MSLPPLDRQRETGTALHAVDEKIRAHEKIIRAGVDLRAILSDLLMSGRLPADPSTA